MSKRSPDPDQELWDIIAHDREQKQAQDAEADQKRRQERESQRIPQAIENLLHSTGDEDGLIRLTRLLDALRDAGKAGVLNQLPERGDARRFTRRCIELLMAGNRAKALELLGDIGPGRLQTIDGRRVAVGLDAELARERSMELPNHLRRLLDLPLPEPAPPIAANPPADSSDAGAEETASEVAGKEAASMTWKGAWSE